MTEEFEQLYRDYFQFIYLYALSLTRDEDLAEEITQETFFRAMEHIDRFEGHSRATTWLCQIAKNLYLSHCRDSRRFAAEAFPEDLPAADTPGRTNQHRAGRPAGQKDLETALIDREQAMAIHKVLHRLEEPYREVFQLRLFAELSFAQIGEIFGRTEGWARTTYYRAKIKIKEGLL